MCVCVCVCVCFSRVPVFEYSMLMMCKYITAVRASVSLPQCSHKFCRQHKPPEATLTHRLSSFISAIKVKDGRTNKDYRAPIESPCVIYNCDILHGCP